MSGQRVRSTRHGALGRRANCKQTLAPHSRYLSPYSVLRTSSPFPAQQPIFSQLFPNSRAVESQPLSGHPAITANSPHHFIQEGWLHAFQKLGKKFLRRARGACLVAHTSILAHTSIPPALLDRFHSNRHFTSLGEFLPLTTHHSPLTLTSTSPATSPHPTTRPAGRRGRGRRGRRGASVRRPSSSRSL